MEDINRTGPNYDKYRVLNHFRYHIQNELRGQAIDNWNSTIEKLDVKKKKIGHQSKNYK